MSESFRELSEEVLAPVQMHPGEVVTATVLDIDKDRVTIHAGLKSESVLPVSEFLDAHGELKLESGEQVQVVIKAVDDGSGMTRVSRSDARRLEVWQELEHAFESRTSVLGSLQQKVNGGFIVDVEGVRAFLPGSLVDLRPTRDVSHLEGKALEFKIIKLDRQRNNVVLSRRAVLEEENASDREELLASLQEGITMRGMVKNLTEYGAFVDLGGIDGLLHITDMAWRRVRSPSEIVNVGDEIDVQILKFDRQRQRVSLGMKQLAGDPWVGIKERYPENTVIRGKVTNIIEYGCFVEIEEGVEGLVHVSEMDWASKNTRPGKVVEIDQEVDVMVLAVNDERRRISLGIKQTRPNPWKEFAEQHQVGDAITGEIRSITDFGVFVALGSNIDGLVHLSDLSWTESEEVAARRFEKGQDVTAVVLSIDADRERISLGIKQLEKQAFLDYLAAHEIGTLVSGVITQVAAKEVRVELVAGEVEGVLRASEISANRIDDARDVLQEKQEISAQITGYDRRSCHVNLSIKAMDDNTPEATDASEDQQPSYSSLGDLIRQKLGKKD